jgi:hypothetical protein
VNWARIAHATLWAGGCLWLVLPDIEKFHSLPWH